MRAPSELFHFMIHLSERSEHKIACDTQDEKDTLDAKENWVRRRRKSQEEYGRCRKKSEDDNKRDQESDKLPTEALF